MIDLRYDRYNGGFVVVTFKRPWQAKNNNEVVSSRDTSSDTTSDTTSETSWRQAGDKLETSSGQVKDLIDALPTGYLSLSEMMAACGKESRTSFLENYVSPAIEGGYIERKYPDSPNHPKQQYRLTSIGLALKAKK